MKNDYFPYHKICDKDGAILHFFQTSLISGLIKKRYGFPYLVPQ